MCYREPVAIDLHWQTDPPLSLSFGTGRGMTGTALTLADVTHPQWQEVLTACDAQWLLHLAQQESHQGRRFTRLEIQRAAQHTRWWWRRQRN